MWRAMVSRLHCDCIPIASRLFADGSSIASSAHGALTACISPASSLLPDDKRAYRVFIAPFAPAFITFVADDARTPREVFTMGAFAARGAAMLTRFSVRLRA
ncbi:hypothetical protein [Paraburkholderia sp. J94]|uniref:hypothetical protein n=1 Tax=Paraburkholderia sp. J94 TaxID=2805441 RepID=UPI002AB2875E|nr:hypothetical protein [Paraburkholderia sp. J94]